MKQGRECRWFPPWSDNGELLGSPRALLSPSAAKTLLTLLARALCLKWGGICPLDPDEAAMRCRWDRWVRNWHASTVGCRGKGWRCGACRAAGCSLRGCRRGRDLIRTNLSAGGKKSTELRRPRHSSEAKETTAWGEDHGESLPPAPFILANSNGSAPKILALPLWLR